MNDGGDWTCPMCRATVRTRYCDRCGEEPLPPNELTLRGMAEKALHASTSIDARTARSAWQLMRYPGELTLAWTAGVRRAFVAPFQLFLIANVLFFSLQWLTGENVFSSSLDSHLHHQDWSELAQSLVARRLAQSHTDLAQYGPVFDRAVVLNAKSMIVFMAVPFALLLPLVFVRARRPFMTHVAFSLHLYTFMLLVFCVALLAAKFSAMLGFGGLDARWLDNVLSIANLAVCAADIHLAIGPVYGAEGAPRLVKAIVLAVAVAMIVVGYRFAMFLLTLYAT
jgi:hypothetical protein